MLDICAKLKWRLYCCKPETLAPYLMVVGLESSKADRRSIISITTGMYTDTLTMSIVTSVILWYLSIKLCDVPALM